MARRERRIDVVLAVWLAAGVPGCADEHDPLDPEVLAEIARERGDAEGTDLSGLYLGTFEPLACGCEEQNADFDASLCAAIEQLTAFGFDDQLDVEIVQADGHVRVSALPLRGGSAPADELVPTLYGPLQADGDISAGGVLQADAVLVQGIVLGRLDGTLVDRTLEAEYQQRYSVELLPGVDRVVLDVTSVDCRERIGMSLTWVGPPPTPFFPEG